MRRNLLTSLLPAAVALMMATGLLLAAQAPASAAEDPDGESLGAFLDDLAPGWSVLQRLVAIGVLPESARDAFVRVRIEQSEQAAPGSVCRRVAAASSAPDELVERCRLLGQDEGAIAPAAACRRVASATDPAATLVERCRAWLASETEPEAGRLALCRRIAAATDAPADLVERCRAILDAGATLSPESACRRIAAAEAPPADLVERCRAWLNSDGPMDAPGRAAVCRRIAAGEAVEAVDADLVERCRAILASAASPAAPARERTPALERTTSTPARTPVR